VYYLEQEGAGFAGNRREVKKLYSVVLTGTGSYLPPKILTNLDIEKKVDTSNEWIVERTGIYQRHIVEDGVATSDLAVPAVKKAMESAGVGVDDIGMIITATSTPDMGFPSTSCFIQKKMGIGKCIAFDVTAACCGFIYALSTAEQFIKSGAVERAIVVGSEVMSSIVDWEDRGTCVLFGDGAGAVVLERGKTPGKGIVASQLFADGKYSDILKHPGFGSSQEVSGKAFEGREHYLKMKGADTFKMAVRLLSQAFSNVMKEQGLTVADIDLFIIHQANIRIINMVCQYLSIPKEKVFVNIAKYGNTSAASVPIALDEAFAEGMIKEGALVLLGAFGGGLTWGTALLRI